VLGDLLVGEPVTESLQHLEVARGQQLDAWMLPISISRIMW
jgi:hypothetical protein